MKIKRKQDYKEKRKKIKRQISIFTIMLWIFIISTMIWVTVNSTKKTNALEVEDKNWNISLVMYDRSSDTPNQAITEFTWNAVEWNETKQLCMQINYVCTTGKEYKPGEIEISINGFEKNGSELNKNYYPNVVIGADEISDTSKVHDWSYKYDRLNNMFTFINNGVVAENEHFEGTIQLVYNLKPIFRIKTNIEFMAKIKENIENAEEIIAKNSNLCNFHYTSMKSIYEIENNISNAPKSIYQNLEDVINDYYWVVCNYTTTKNDAPIIALDQNANSVSNVKSQCIREQLEEGCVLYNNRFNKIEAKENNTYYYLPYEENYYIGYPKDKYKEGEKIENTVELWGRYEDEEEVQKLAEDTKTISLVDFDFEYTGKLYNITKSSQSEDINLSSIKSNVGTNTTWKMGMTAFYTDGVMDVEIGDDLLYIENKKLNEDEYNFNGIKIPVFYTYNKFTGEAGDVLEGYNYEVQVRYKGSQEYVISASGVTGKTYNVVNFEKNVVGIKLVIKDLDKTIYPSSSDDIEISVNIHNATNHNISSSSFLYNFNYLQVYRKDNEGNRTLANEVTVDSYKIPSTLEISEYDISTYGKYMQRSYAKVNIRSGKFELSSLKARGNLINNVRKEKYEIQYEIENILRIENYSVDKDCIIKQYDILPSGMYLTSSKEEIIDEIYSKYRYRHENTYDYGYIENLDYYRLKLKDGTSFETLEKLIDYIKENTSVEIDYNYRNSGRTKISVIYNLNGIDWSYYLNHSSRICKFRNKVKSRNTI